MPAGLQVLNNFGTLLIDDTSANMTFASRGAATTIDPGPDFAQKLVAVPSPAATPAYAIRHASVPVMLVGASPAGFIVASHLQTASVEWYKFDGPPPPVSNYGLQVRDAAGRLMFDSNRKVARVHDVVPLSLANNYTATRTYTAGRTYAVIVGGVWLRVVNNVVTFEGRFDSLTHPITSPRNALVIDVTGY